MVLFLTHRGGSRHSRSLTVTPTMPGLGMSPLLGWLRAPCWAQPYPEGVPGAFRPAHFRGTSLLSQGSELSPPWCFCAEIPEDCWHLDGLVVGFGAKTVCSAVLN